MTLVAAFAVSLLALASSGHAETTMAPGADAIVIAAAPAAGPTADDRSIRPFTVHVSQAALDDLRRRADRNAMARQGNRRRSVAGHAVGQAAGARSLLGHGLRLAEGGGEAECPAAVRHDDRRARHSLHPRPLPSSECPASHHHPWLAGVRLGAAQDHRSAHGPHRTRRTRGGRLRCRHTLDARLRLLRQADGHRLESRSHRASLGRADEAHRLHALRRPGWRLGLPHLERDGAPGAGRIARHPHQLAGDGTARRGRGARWRRACAGGTVREGTRGVRLARHVLQDAQGLRRR